MEVSKTFSDKLMLQVEIMPLQSQSDTRFIKPGTKMAAFTYDGNDLKVGQVMEADGEYIGGPTGGQVYLTNLHRTT